MFPEPDEGPEPGNVIPAKAGISNQPAIIHQAEIPDRARDDQQPTPDDQLPHVIPAKAGISDQPAIIRQAEIPDHARDDEGLARIVDVPPERYPECLQVLRSAFATEVADYGITRENTPSNPAFWELDFLTRLVAKPTQLFAIEVGGRLVGCAFLGSSRSRPDAAVLRHLAVLPEARHRGYGEELVAEAARRARAAGAARMRIGIVAANTRLAGWYHRLGFVTVETVRYPGLVFDVEHLELEFDPAGGEVAQ